MFIAILTYVKPLAEVNAVFPEHLKYLNNLFSQKKLLIVGKQNPWTGGVIISKKVSREEFEKMMRDDPFTKAGVSQYQIIEFIPGGYDDCLKGVIE